MIAIGYAFAECDKVSFAPLIHWLSRKDLCAHPERMGREGVCSLSSSNIIRSRWSGGPRWRDFEPTAGVVPQDRDGQRRLPEFRWVTTYQAHHATEPGAEKLQPPPAPAALLYLVAVSD